jgi:hypothetical protein
MIMADIVCGTQCTSWLDAHAIPTDCASVDFGFPSMLILAAPDTVFSFASDHLVPSVAEFTTAGSDIFIISDIANGVKMPSERQEITGADTPDNLPEVISETTGISGNIVRFNLDILNDIEKLNCYKRLKLWYVTNKGWCFGGLTGFTIPNYISDWIHEGYGGRSKIPFEFKWVKPAATTTGAALDLTYLDLTN